jgi:glycosyltransferase involved in cell wall biosynthesis
MRKVDMLCHPSVLEGFSLTCLEAMASGLPVVTTPRSGTAEIITHGENGFVVSAGDSVSMAEVTRELFLDPALRRQVGQAARTTAEQLSWRTYERNIGNVFWDIARRGKPD